jgi:hypothetical protein
MLFTEFLNYSFCLRIFISFVYRLDDLKYLKAHNEREKWPVFSLFS